VYCSLVTSLQQPYQSSKDGRCTSTNLSYKLIDSSFLEVMVNPVALILMSLSLMLISLLLLLLLSRRYSIIPASWVLVFECIYQSHPMIMSLPKLLILLSLLIIDSKAPQNITTEILEKGK